jgi:hypothetical protein
MRLRPSESYRTMELLIGLLIEEDSTETCQLTLSSSPLSIDIIPGGVAALA